uniref:hypothetical protein n=1 Tax=Lysinibacillus sp. D4A1_S13 TaxID=2941228 RepID=UPI0020C0E52A
EYGRTVVGIPIINLLVVEKSEWINAIIPVSTFDEEQYLCFTTKQGVSKRTALSQFANIRNNRLIALGLREDDE